MVLIPKIVATRFALRGFRDNEVGELHSILQNPEVLQYSPSQNSPTLEQVEKLVLSQQSH